MPFAPSPAATSIVVPSTATLGAANNVAFRIWIVGFDDGGTFRLGVVNALSGTSIMPLRDDIISSSTLTPANSAQVIYTTGAAVAAKAMRLLGYAEWASGLAAAGTWSIAPTKLQLFGPGVPKPGEVVQVVRTDTGAVANGATAMPFDNTIPQITEGVQFMTQTIVPIAAPNLLKVTLLAMLASAGGNFTIGNALFRDSTANAIAGAYSNGSTTGAIGECRIEKVILAGSVASTTFKHRAGGSAGESITFNGAASAGIFNGVLNSSMEVLEIMA